MSKKNFKTYHIHCAHCNTYLLTYHKFGSRKGILRLYFAHIHAPKSLVNLQADHHRIQDAPNLSCPECDIVIGVSALSRSKKWVFRLRQGFFHRKLIK